MACSEGSTWDLNNHTVHQAIQKQLKETLILASYPPSLLFIFFQCEVNAYPQCLYFSLLPVDLSDFLSKLSVLVLHLHLHPPPLLLALRYNTGDITTH